MERITVKHLDSLIERMNGIVGKDNVFTLSRANGGFNVEVNDRLNVLGYGHRPARDLYNDIHAYMKAMETAFDAIAAMPEHAPSLRTARESAHAALVAAFTK